MSIIELPKSGDIILVKSVGWVSSLIVLGQLILRPNLNLRKFTNNNYSHGLLVIDSNTVIHSNKRSLESDSIDELISKGVGINSIAGLELDNKDRFVDFVVYRQVGCSRKLGNICKRMAAKLNGTAYNSLPVLPKFKLIKNSDNYFCTEFIALVFSQVGQKISNKKPQNTLPKDIGDFCSKSDQWEDVTKDYKKILPNLKAIVEKDPQATLSNLVTYDLGEAFKQERSSDKAIEKLEKRTAKLQKILNEQKIY